MSKEFLFVLILVFSIVTSIRLMLMEVIESRSESLTTTTTTTTTKLKSLDNISKQYNDDNESAFYALLRNFGLWTRLIVAVDCALRLQVFVVATTVGGKGEPLLLCSRIGVEMCISLLILNTIVDLFETIDNNALLLKSCDTVRRVISVALVVAIIDFHSQFFQAVRPVFLTLTSTIIVVFV
jgi:hypothetical protein